MHVSDAEYQSHAVFDELDHQIAFYDALAESVFFWVTQGTEALGNIDSYVYSSMKGTLSSISTILRDGRINDAYALLRKYYDSAVINIYSNVFLDEHFAIDNFIVEQIDNWLKGEEKLPQYRVMSQYIRASSKVAGITGVLHADDRYKVLRARCNDHTHYNYYRNVLLNDDEVHIRERGRALDEFLADVLDVFVFHVAYLFCVRENYMMSRDHVDALELGRTPETDSEYWVAPFIQEVFDRTLAKHRPDVAQCLRSHTSMHLT